MHVAEVTIDIYCVNQSDKGIYTKTEFLKSDEKSFFVKSLKDISDG